MNAASTATTYTGSSSEDSCHQVENGAEVRSMAPTAPRITTIQKPLTKASRTARGSTCDHETAAPRWSQLDAGAAAAVVSGTRAPAAPAAPAPAGLASGSGGRALRPP